MKDEPVTERDRPKVERVEGPTPAGGVHSEAYRDEHGRVVEIAEFDEFGRVIARTYAGRDESRFEAHIGNGLEGYYGVRSHGERVIWSLERAGTVENLETVSPTEEQWADFWQELAAAGVWAWAEGYADETAVDGTYWGVRAEHDGRAVESYGANAYPDGFEGFCAAVSRLAGGKTFQ